MVKFDILKSSGEVILVRTWISWRFEVARGCKNLYKAVQHRQMLLFQLIDIVKFELKALIAFVRARLFCGTHLEVARPEKFVRSAVCY